MAAQGAATDQEGNLQGVDVDDAEHSAFPLPGNLFLSPGYRPCGVEEIWRYPMKSMAGE